MSGNKKVEKSSTDSERAKKYVEFYYFWKFHYCARNYWLELDRMISGGSKKRVFYPSESQDRLLKKIYFAHPLSRMEPKFALEGQSHAEIDELLSACEGASFSKPHHILEMLCSGKEIEKSLVSDDFCGGMKILGTNGMYVAKGGVLKGKIIVEIDLSSQLDLITLELCRLKEATFSKFPDFTDGPEINAIESNPQILVDLIRQKTNSAFSANDDPARAIGLWFWDMLCGPEPIFTNFAELWSLIATQTSEKYYISTKANEPIDDQLSWLGMEYRKLITPSNPLFIGVARLDDPHSIQWLPTLQVFSQLGYAASDPAVFRRLYRNTQKCIDACEVLSLK